ncbi:MAG: WD40/YVTN/BNR-like repeat-containing protein, partial [Candidatus Aminicenantales bacterium]
MTKRSFLFWTLSVCVTVVHMISSPGFSENRFDEGILEAVPFRSLGPYRAGSWITDIAVPESPQKAHLTTFYVGTRNGGVWKTTNNGTTFEPIFDDQTRLSIGAVAVAPSNPEIVWVGTGEVANARSSYSGDGVYKSVDAGKTWIHTGLRDSHHIARIVIHPHNPDIVYVAAMGHLYSFNPERGVFKTEDGGRTWRKVLYINEKVGVIDLAMDRSHPDVLYAAAYEKYRYPWHFEEGGPESGIYKTEDGGNTWKRLGGGLPSGKIGRIGLDIFQKNPNIVVAVVENANPLPPSSDEKARDLTPGRTPPEPRVVGGEVYRSEDAGKTWTRVNPPGVNIGGKAAYSFNMIRIDPNDDQKIFVTGICLANSTDGGKTWNDVDWPPRRRFLNQLGGGRTHWID